MSKYIILLSYLSASNNIEIRKLTKVCIAYHSSVIVIYNIECFLTWPVLSEGDEPWSVLFQLQP